MAGTILRDYKQQKTHYLRAFVFSSRDEDFLNNAQKEGCSGDMDLAYAIIQQ